MNNGTFRQVLYFKLKIMKKIIVCISIAVFLFAGCTKSTEDKKSLTYSDFVVSLNAGMDYNAIVAKFGEPTKDIGSGIHIYVYQLSDLTEIWIGYVDRIIYARHVDVNQQVLHIII
jgi:hypothetical protein